MFKETNKKFSFETELLRSGAYTRYPVTNPEAMPIYMTTAFNVEDLDDLEQRYKEKGFCYNRNRNANRSALAELLTQAENGDDTIVCSSGMAAIYTSIISIVKAGDHIIADQTLYGETIEIFTEIMKNYGIETTFTDFTDLNMVKANIRSNTKLFYTETIANPMITVADIDELGNIAHANNAFLVVDNTFMTAVGFRPLEHNADLTVISLTKFANGHSDAVCGAIVGKSELIAQAYKMQILTGCTADPFTSWLVSRGMRTMHLRVEKQMANALKLAEALEESPYVEKVNYPGLKSHKQYELASKLFTNGFGGMMSIILPEDRKKMNAFMRRLNLAHYAMTLGGYRTTLSYPVLSSHYDMPEKDRLKIGITNGMMRISVGIENSGDLVEDFLQALSVYA
ncbi:trans-sulfuration enzyme family protein [Pectinatus haikarae]|uniref:Cystathionine beta-lyase/cystathionine gamma-synthase n=1 Tax=Pectinatus haikarae TaxID=349096 RepID=A0ABT9YB90_9FIRM|nr:aminotransferase class I/II-fold pyridoxal phosphate-dependent enzyme [Pectinatus haikarae]MDQ0204811.1 cystathionine beta-lyase/cystathionine gamma-synthase [Pectinatus haikarae]